ncbi:MAG: NAD(P)H-dependent oxidoreductase subunit E [Oligoflexia bacterium]|nr:NAD(P)H-dependent oxidoreductase subunit E [Oligoflexia bacterium]
MSRDHTILTPKVLEKISHLREHFPVEALTIPLLHAIQDEHGYVSREAISESAAHLGLPLAKVLKVATFYTIFNQEPKGKLHLQVCTNIACWLNGANDLVAHLEQRLGIKAGETTTDGKFSLSRVECLAACGTAPAMQVNDTYVENLSKAKLDHLIDKWSKSECCGICDGDGGGGEEEKA